MGMFDSVWFDCPYCAEREEVQSKAGDCVLDDFHQSDVPPHIAIDLEKSTKECSQCGERFEVIMLDTPATIRMSAVKLNKGAKNQ